MEKKSNGMMDHSQVHPTAIIHPGAKLGKNVKIGAYSIIGEDVQIGDNCDIGPCVVVDGATIVGNNNKFFNGCTIGCESLAIQNDASGLLSIGDNNTFRENVIVCRGIRNDGTKIGDFNLLITNTYIGYDCQIGSHTIISHCTILANSVVVEERAIISPLSVVFEYTRIGKMAMIGAGSKIIKDVPPFFLVDGNPAIPAGINVVGLRRNEINSEGREQIKRAYRILYRSNLTLHDAIERIATELEGSKEIDYFTSFLRDSKRGILSC